MPLDDEKAIWREAHDIATREIERIRSGKWGGGLEPHPGLAAAIANFAIAKVEDRAAKVRAAAVTAERVACAEAVAALKQELTSLTHGAWDRGFEDALKAAEEVILNRSN